MDMVDSLKEGEDKSSMADMLESCEMCPRRCGVNRYHSGGFCHVGAEVRIARAALHYMEEPCISGQENDYPTREDVGICESERTEKGTIEKDITEKGTTKNEITENRTAEKRKERYRRSGSGTIFFSGCNLKCCFCQNHVISHEGFGKDISIERLAEIMLELQDKGANNINLVTGIMYVPQIVKALESIHGRLHIPVVYNSSGYERVENIRMLAGYVNIYLVDIKYYSEERAIRYSNAPKYFDYAHKCLDEMIRQTGSPVFYDGKCFDDESALLKSGVIVRHLVMPGGRKDSMDIVRYLAENFHKEDYILSLMSQFTPHYRCDEHQEINRKVTTYEYDSVVRLALELGLDQTYVQDRASIGAEYTPKFELEGVEKSDKFNRKLP